MRTSFGVFLAAAILLCTVSASPAARSGEASAPPPGAGPIMRYTGPGGEGDNYALTVLQRGPEFTEDELLRYCDDVYPVAGKNPERMLRYMTDRKGWESDRVYYLMAKIFLAERTLAARSGETGLREKRTGGMSASAGEADLVRKHQARIPAAFGGGREMGNRADPAYVANAGDDLLDPFSDDWSMRTVVESNREFSAVELDKALADMSGKTKFTLRELVDAMQAKGWERNRAFYMAFRIRVGYIAMTDPAARKGFEKEFPAGLPSPRERALMKKRLPEIKAASYTP